MARAARPRVLSSPPLGGAPLNGAALSGAALCGVALTAGVLAGCAATPVAVPAGMAAPALAARATLALPNQGQGAFTYDPQTVPVGARVEVAADDHPDGTEVSLDVAGLLPERGYAAHLHVAPCGAQGADAGPHYQDRVDPAAAPGKPSSDPAYANPGNEVWLDLHTDASGEGEVVTEVPFRFTDRRPRSVVLHEAETTRTDAGHAGMAGDRLACVTLPA